jgi:ubiquinone/menaquinone biosynthesis C-methylase UbiE
MSDTKQEKIRNHYNAVADTYDHHYDHHRGRNYHTHLSNHLIRALPEKGDLLDIGCGTGLFIEKYIGHGGTTAVGIDISQKMVERGRKRCPGCEFIVGNGEKIPFRDCSFDGISSVLAFSYVKQPEEMLSETFRVLRPGGTIALCTLGKKLLTRSIPALYQIGEKIKVKHVVMKDFGEYYYNEEEMQALFSQAGYTDISVRWCSFAHIDMFDPLFNLATKIEPFVEKRLPQLAYNIFVSAKKPKD